MEETKVVAIGYFNVHFLLLLKSELDEMKLQYFVNRIESGEQMQMRDIDHWCRAQGIEYKSRFIYRKDLPIRANIWNLYSYIRFCLTRKTGKEITNAI